MGWTHDDYSEHEGYVVAVVREPDGYRWSELGTDEPRESVKVSHIQVGCECGWRSRRIIAPLGTEFWPSCVFFAEAHGHPGVAYWDEVCYQIWKLEHLPHIGDGTLLGFVLKHDVQPPAPLGPIEPLAKVHA